VFPQPPGRRVETSPPILKQKLYSVFHFSFLQFLVLSFPLLRCFPSSTQHMARNDIITHTNKKNSAQFWNLVAPRATQTNLWKSACPFFDFVPLQSCTTVD
jgi:hypothetical protein